MMWGAHRNIKQYSIIKLSYNQPALQQHYIIVERYKIV